jgi:branched-chain amino acid aminotransferase
MIHSLNGSRVSDDEPALVAGDRGFTLGDGLFETIAVAEGVPRHLDRHLARLESGLARLAIEAPAPAHLAGVVRDIIAANGLNRGVVRLSVSRGPGGRGLAPDGAGPPTVLATVSDKLPPQTPVSAVLSREVRRNEHTAASDLKSLSYIDNVIARQEATARGADDALILNTAGRVAEASVANVVAVRDGEAVTPPLVEGCLPGIARAVLLESGLLRERALTPAALYEADALILTNALTIRAVTALDGHALTGAETVAWADRLRQVVFGDDGTPACG